ncbi:MAG TPA: hypothetical protein VFM46_08370 [Pseudomonadales bacterium]|nr:hypothetical protein [Pseudomonadales bacterium]
MDGDTIHSFFELPSAHIDPDGNFAVSDKNRPVPENVRYLIVDEVSTMLPNMPPNEWILLASNAS